jgi:hypothetical protein
MGAPPENNETSLSVKDRKTHYPEATSVFGKSSGIGVSRVP